MFASVLLVFALSCADLRGLKGSEILVEGLTDSEISVIVEAAKRKARILGFDLVPRRRVL